MAFKKIFIFTLFSIFVIPKICLAQETIVPDLSDNYLDKLISTAIQNYPKIKTYQTRVDIANTNISKTKISLLEALTVSYVYQPGTATVDPTNPSTSYFKGLQAGIFLNVGTLLEKPYQVKQAKQELLIANNERDEYMINITTEVKKRYYVYVQRLAELKLQTKSVQDVEGALKDMRYKFEKGEETFEEYNKVQSDFTNHQLSKIEAETNLFLAKADLEEMLGTKMENVK